MKPSRMADLSCVATYVGIALALVFHFLSAGLSPASAQTATPASSLYCQPGDSLIGGFCVHNIGKVPTPDKCPPGFGPVSAGSLAGCGGASSAFFSAQNFSNILRTTSQETNDLIFERLRER